MNFVRSVEMSPKTTGKGWSVITSIIEELDVALYYINDRSGVGQTLKDFYPITSNIPQGWVDEFNEIFGQDTDTRSILEGIAMLAGVMKEPDYDKATMKMREMDIEKALSLATVLGKEHQIQPDTHLSKSDQVVDLILRVESQEVARLEIHPLEEYYLQFKRRLEISMQLLQGGKYHDRFWHWLDRYYYETYRPWRITRQPILDQLETKALTMLGSVHNDDSVPNLDWLSEFNTINNQPGIYNAVKKGLFHVNFWVDPFGLADSFVFLPGELIVSFAEPGEIFGNFYAFGKNLAGRLQALADPNRLVILRLIRNIGMSNTDMAKLLHISRPTVSIHVKILREAGLIRSRQDGRIMRHEIIPEALHKTLIDLEKFLDIPPLLE